VADAWGRPSGLFGARTQAARAGGWRALIGVALLGLLLVAAGCGTRRGAAGRRAASDPNVVVVYVSCGLASVIEAARVKFEAENKGRFVEIETGEPLALMRKLQEGAKADVFVCLGEAEIGALERDGILEKSSRGEIGKYSLVLATPSAKPAIADCQDLDSPKVEAVVMPAPGFDSLGTYAKRELERLKLWLPIQSKLHVHDTPLKALQALAAGKADVGVLFDPCPLLNMADKVPAHSVTQGPALSQKNAKPTAITIGVHKRSPKALLAHHFATLLGSERMKPDLAAAGVPMEAQESGEPGP